MQSRQHATGLPETGAMVLMVASCVATLWLAIPAVSVAAHPPGQAAAASQDAKKPRADEAVNVPPRMSVLVLGPDGKPVPGAQVHASVWTREDFPSNRDYDTNQAGVATVELPKTLSILRIWARMAHHPPLFAQWWKERQPDGGEIPEKFTFQLQAGTTVGGRVLNEDGQPIAGAKVEVMRPNTTMGQELAVRPVLGTWLAEGDDEPCAARDTDALGRWTLDNVPRERGLQLRVKLSHPDYVADIQWGGYQHEQGVTVEQLQAQTATLTMKHGIRLRGVVIAESTKQRIAHAVVVWGDDPYMEQGPQEVLTSERGLYRLSPLLPQTLRVTVVAQGWAPQMKQVELNPANMDEQFSLESSFRLQRGRTLRIQFVDQAGEPVGGVGVGIRSWRGVKSLYNHRHPNVLNTKIPTQANEQGLYEWTWAPEDEVVYSYYKEGYGSGTISLTAAEQTHEVVLQKAGR